MLVRELVFKTDSLACAPIKLIKSHRTCFSGLYYKPMTIVNDDSRVVNKLEASLTDDARVVISDCHMFIVQATGEFRSLIYLKMCVCVYVCKKRVVVQNKLNLLLKIILYNK